jgi:regulator of protease activity HflC (stomatin/prohibitin superfamily)
MRFGATTGRVLEPGAHFITPFVEGLRTVTVRTMIYETTTEDKQKGSNADYKDYPVDTNTSDGQRVDIFYTVRFSIDPATTTKVVNEFGSEAGLMEKVVKTESRIWARNIPREYQASELYSGDGVVKVQLGIEEKLRPTFKQYGLILDSVGVREINFTDQYVQAIEAKQIEAVKIETEKNKAEQAKYRKEATIRDAEAEAEKQRIQSQTITATFLQKEWIQKWNGVLPIYMMGDNASTLIQLPK